MKLDYRNFYEAAEPGICALINTQDKKILIIRSECVVETLGRIVKKLKKHQHDIKELNWDRYKLEFIMLETTTNDRHVKALKFRHWQDHYLAQGYTLYNRRKIAAYVLRTKLRGHKFYVEAVYWKRSFILGVFEHKLEVDEFLKTYYPTGKIENFIYASNELTKKYFESLKDPEY